MHGEEDVRIAQLRLKNFLAYRGEHVLKLEAKPYAIVARREDDVDSSNWAGKSALVEAIKFVLDGSHRHRLDDEWITEGEQAGEVEAIFDTGERALRSRERGHATKFYFWLPNAIEPSFKADAQRDLEVRMGIDASDFDSTWFFEQGQMARIINARPEDRMKMVATWLKLGPLEACEDKVRARVNAMIDDMQKLTGRREAARKRLMEALGGRSRELVTVGIEGAAGKVAAARASLRDAEAAWEANEERRRAAIVRDEYAQLVAEGTKLAEEVEAVDIDALKKTWEMNRAKATLSREAAGEKTSRVKQLAIVARGEFDGRCPIADIECPATTKINAERTTGKITLDRAKNAETASRKEAMDLDALLDVSLRAFNDAGSKGGQLERLRERAAKLADEADKVENVPQPEDGDAIRLRMLDMRQHVEDRQREHTNAARVIEVADAVDAEELTIDAEVQIVETNLRLARAALTVFGKQGAQRKIAEEVLGGIEEEANVMLSNAGIALSVSVQWTRDGQGLAKACDSCGASFPASAKVKACPRCSAPRGPQLQNKLEFILSDTSGAAKDLAGIAIQLAASQWLREDRKSDWNTIVIDEAFAQTDKSTRRALSTQLRELLRFQQAFIIAHSPEVLDCLPGKIEIVVDRKGNRSIHLIS